MKKILFGSLLALLAVVATSCSKNDEVSGEGKEAALTVSLSTGKTRALLPGTPTAADDLLDQENIVKNFTAFVFTASSGRLEAKGSTTSGTVTLSNLNTATPKTLVVVANAAIDIAVGTGNISELSGVANFIDLDTQEYEKVKAGEGMAMHISKNITLVEGNNEEEAEIERLAGKVALKDITVEVDPALGFTAADLDNFKVTGVTMQKVIGKAGFLGHNTGVFYGGISGGDLISTVQKGYLTDDFPAGKQTFTDSQTHTYGNFFYVLPNAGTVEGTNTKHYTMLTVIAEYDGEDVYFPVVVKDPRDNIERIKNNTSYTISLKIKDLQGSPGPEIPKGEATLEVTIDVAEWDVAPVQVEEW